MVILGVMATITEALSMAVAHHQSGRLQAAEQIYRQILAAQPDQVDAIHLLGVLAHQLGKHEIAVELIGRAIMLNGNEAVLHNNLGEAYRALSRNQEAAECYRRAVELKPDYVEAHANLGAVLKSQGRLQEAAASYRRVLVLKPDHAATHINLGNVLTELGLLEEAAACFRRAIDRKVDSFEVHYNLGNTLKSLGKVDEAAACYRRSLELKPDFYAAHNNLGIALKAQGKLEEAINCFRRALEAKPDFVEALGNLGNALADQGRLEEAIACHRQALALKPDSAEALSNLGIAFKDQGRLEEAVACHRQALAMKPDFAETHNNLGVALMAQDRLEEAVGAYRRAIELKPGFAETHNNLGVALMRQGRLEEAISCHRQALALKPDDTKAHDNLLAALHYCPDVTLASLAKAHAEFDRRHAAPLRGATAQAKTFPDRHARPRLGFVSADLGLHPVGFFLIRMLENLGREQAETVCYSDRIVKDGMTQRFQAAASQWRDVRGLSDEQLAEQIRADQIDVLFDLAGHTAQNRLLAFARKPAPIQVSWIGYEGTTGLTTMDYLLADRHVIPEGCEQHYREQVLRMPDGYLCYDPPAGAPPVGPAPSLANGYATFGSFNNLAKITPQVVEVWAKILQRMPTARLILKYRGLGEPAVQRRYLDLFADRNVPPERLELLPLSSRADYLATYQQVDVALDPFPFSGSATTCDTLWMGVPVITCPFETFASRHTLSHLSNIGLTETIAHNLDEYVNLAVSLAVDPDQLAELRSSLRERVASSPLCDGQRFAANFMALVSQVWRE